MRGQFPDLCFPTIGHRERTKTSWKDEEEEEEVRAAPREVDARLPGELGSNTNCTLQDASEGVRSARLATI